MHRTVHQRASKVPDIEIHVSTVTTDGGQVFGEIREYVVSLDTYGRGVTFPLTDEILDALHNGVDSLVPVKT